MTNRVFTPLGSERRNQVCIGSLCTVLVLASILVLPSLCPSLLIASDQEVTGKAITRRPVDSGGQGNAAEAPALGKGDLYALVVGVSEYRHPEVTRLRLSAKDARDFGEFLKTQRKVFRNVHLKTMLNEEATKVEVEKYLGYELPKAGKDDTVILFFSGHGSGDPKKPGEYFFLTHESDPNFLEATAVRMSGLAFLKNLDAGRVLLVADACHAGMASQIRTKSIEKALGSFIKEVKESSGTVIMTSSKPNEYSQEREGLDNSVFTHFLLKGLKGEADTNRNGLVTLREAYDYVYERTKDETRGAQHPQLETSMVGTFPVSVLGELEDSLKLEVRYVAQDPQCTNPACTDPPEDATQCTDPLCKDVSIDDGSTMFCGQNYQVAFRPSATGYVYVYQIDAKGEIYKLFPGTAYVAAENPIDNPLKGGQIYWIPAKEKWLRHGEQQGKEKIYVVASRSKNSILEDLYGHLEKLRGESGKTELAKEIQGELESYLRTMAPAKIVKKVAYAEAPPSTDDKTRSFEFLSQIIESSGLDAVNSVSFTVNKR